MSNFLCWIAVATVFSSVAAQTTLPKPVNIRITPGTRNAGFQITMPSGADGKKVRVTAIPQGDGLSNIESIATIFGTLAILSMSGLTPGINYTARAVVFEGANEGPALEKTFSTKGEVPSGPVRDIRRPTLTSTAVRLTWSEPSANHINSPGGITQYFVELRNKETSNRCGDTVHMQQTVSQDSRVVTFNNLTPFTEYCIRIYPENSFGRAREASVRSGDYTFSTQESAPGTAPVFTIIQPQFRTASIAWSRPTQPNGLLTNYILQYKASGSSSWTPVNVNAASKYQTFLSGTLQQGNSYDIRIAAKNSAGRGPFSGVITFVMSPAIDNFKVCRLNDSSAIVIWNITSEQAHGLGGDLTHVDIRYSGGDNNRNVRVKSGVERAVIGELDTENQYEVELASIWSEVAITSETSDEISIPSNTNCAPGRPRNIQFSNVATKSFDVSFDPPTTANGRIVQYSITAVSQDGRLPYSRTIQTGPAARQGTFGNLEEAVTYEVTISAENQFTSGDSNSDEVMTGQDVPTGPVRNVQLTKEDARTIRVTWRDPPYKHLNSPSGITRYRVTANMDTCNDQGNKKEVKEREVFISGLTPGTTYCIRVSPGNSDGFARPATAAAADQTITLPPVPTAPELVGVTATSNHVIIIWEPVDVEGEDPIINYNIAVQSDDTSRMVYNHSASLPTYYNITGLLPNKSYNITLNAQTRLGIGFDRLIEVKTFKGKDGAPGVNVATITVSTTSVSTKTVTTTSTKRKTIRVTPTVSVTITRETTSTSILIESSCTDKTTTTVSDSPVISTIFSTIKPPTITVTKTSTSTSISPTVITEISTAVATLYSSCPLQTNSNTACSPSTSILTSTVTATKSQPCTASTSCPSVPLIKTTTITESPSCSNSAGPTATITITGKPEDNKCSSGFIVHGSLVVVVMTLWLTFLFS